MTTPMRRMLVKATVTEATDEGTFTAVISTITVDRDDDIVEPAAVVAALQAWAPLGKMIPLAWNHETDADYIVGHIVPGSVEEKDGEVTADGWIDQSIERGKHAWRLVKSGTLGFSYGYLVKTAEPRGKGSGLHITELDIFEITATPIPANADTRVLSFKSLEELREAMSAVEQAEEEHHLPEVEVVEAEPVEEPPPAVDEVHASLEELREQVKRLERDETARKEAAVVQSAQVETAEAQVADARDALVALEHFDPGEVDGMKRGTLTAVWTAAYINDLPDSAFLHVEAGGTKDTQGKTTPRDMRRFPYKDTAGVVDLPHLRNALVQVQATALPTHVKDRLTARGQRILDNAVTVDVTDQEKAPPGEGSRSVDPLRKQADDVALEQFSGGLDRRKPPRPVEHPKPRPAKSLAELKQEMHDITLTLLSD